MNRPKLKAMKSTMARLSARAATLTTPTARPAPARQTITRAEMAGIFAADLYGQRQF